MHDSAYMPLIPLIPLPEGENDDELLIPLEEHSSPEGGSPRE
jgi:hypothetical protein